VDNLLPVIAISVTIISAVWGHALWLSGQFKSVYKAIDLKFDKILDSISEKLEYHERHDDQRFGHISDSIWELRLQQALNSGNNILAKAKKDTTGAGGETPSSGR
jgi:hypothetical protein